VFRCSGIHQEPDPSDTSHPSDPKPEHLNI
jgi:hypothetical protein